MVIKHHHTKLRIFAEKSGTLIKEIHDICISMPISLPLIDEQSKPTPGSSMLHSEASNLRWALATELEYNKRKQIIWTNRIYLE